MTHSRTDSSGMSFIGDANNNLLTLQNIRKCIYFLENRNEVINTSISAFVSLILGIPLSLLAYFLFDEANQQPTKSFESFCFIMSSAFVGIPAMIGLFYPVIAISSFLPFPSIRSLIFTKNNEINNMIKAVSRELAIPESACSSTKKLLTEFNKIFPENLNEINLAIFLQKRKKEIFCLGLFGKTSEKSSLSSFHQHSLFEKKLIPLIHAFAHEKIKI